jgi:glycosyltransferase involved in cell wall biosynthesis
MKEPLVSVDMITYNQKSYIARTIEGALQQKTNFPFEIVIGEDCSTDGTREIVFEYQKKYPDIIRIITSDKNVGGRENAWRTMMACRGKYLADCEGDDYWHNPYKLQKQADYLESHPECGLVHSDHDRFFVKNGKTIKNFCRTTNKIPPRELNVFRGWGAGLNILTCTVMVRRDLLMRLFSDTYLYQSDNYIGGLDIVFSEIALVSKIHYMDESLSTYTVQIESASNMKNPIEKLKFSISGYDGNIYNARKYHCYDEIPDLEKGRDMACLWLAFYERNAQLAKEIKEKSDLFSLKERLLYLGAINLVFHYAIYLPVVILKKIQSSVHNYRLFYR